MRKSNSGSFPYPKFELRIGFGLKKSLFTFCTVIQEYGTKSDPYLCNTNFWILIFTKNVLDPEP